MFLLFYEVKYNLHSYFQNCNNYCIHKPLEYNKDFDNYFISEECDLNM